MPLSSCFTCQPWISSFNMSTEAGTQQTVPFFACSWNCCDKSFNMYVYLDDSLQFGGICTTQIICQGIFPVNQRQETVQAEVQLTSKSSANHAPKVGARLRASWWSAGAWIIQLQLACLTKPKPPWDCCDPNRGREINCPTWSAFQVSCKQIVNRIYIKSLKIYNTYI